MSKRDELVSVIAGHTSGRWTPEGLADAVLGTMREPSPEMTEAMADVIAPRLSVFGNVSGRDVYQAAIEAAQ